MTDDLLAEYTAARERFEAAAERLRAADVTLPPDNSSTPDPKPFDWLAATPQECAAESRRLGLAGTLTSPDWRFRR